MAFVKLYLYRDYSLTLEMWQFVPMGKFTTEKVVFSTCIVKSLFFNCKDKMILHDFKCLRNIAP